MTNRNTDDITIIVEDNNEQKKELINKINICIIKSNKKILKKAKERRINKIYKLLDNKEIIELSESELIDKINFLEDKLKSIRFDIILSYEYRQRILNSKKYNITHFTINRWIINNIDNLIINNKNINLNTQANVEIINILFPKSIDNNKNDNNINDIIICMMITWLIIIIMCWSINSLSMRH